MVTVINMANPGNIANHQAGAYSRALLNNLPQVITSDCVPIPKKDKLDSAKMAPATQNAIEISTGVKAFGMACLKIIRHSG